MVLKIISLGFSSENHICEVQGVLFLWVLQQNYRLVFFDWSLGCLFFRPNLGFVKVHCVLSIQRDFIVDSLSLSISRVNLNVSLLLLHHIESMKLLRFVFIDFFDNPFSGLRHSNIERGKPSLGLQTNYMIETACKVGVFPDEPL